jgi:hypothetical protein
MRAFFPLAEGRVLRVVRRRWYLEPDVELPAADGAVVNVCLHDRAISCWQFDIWLQEGRVWVRQEPDTNRADPVVLNKETFDTERHELRPGDVLRVIDYSLTLRNLDLAWLLWDGGTVPQLARAIYDEGRFDDLPVLADALEDAGCQEADLLAHGRSAGPHSLHCWVLDMVLGLAMAHSLPGQQAAIERRRIQEALQNSGYSRVRAADTLGIHRNTLYRKMRKHGMMTVPLTPSAMTVPPPPPTAAADNHFNPECEGLGGV